MAAKKSRSARRSGNVVSLDLSDVESSGKVSDGDYLVEVVEAEQKDSSNDQPMIAWKFKVVEGGNGTLFYNTSLQPQALFNLRNLLEALEVEIPESSFDLDLDELVGMQMGVSVENEVYQGKKRPRIIDLFPAGEFDPENAGGVAEEEEEDEKPVKKSSTKASAKPSSKRKAADEEEEEDEPADEEIKKGSKVSFEDDGTEYTGTVIKINTKENFAEVKVKGEEGSWEIDLDDLTLA